MELSVPIVTLVSFMLAGSVVSYAFVQKKQFYPSVVYLTKSNASMAVIYLQGLVFVVLLFKIIRKIFFGTLRALETEHLMERSWHAVIETCLAFTVFRDDFSPKFVAMFTLLLFLKSFHWLAEDRVDYMERSPLITVMFHVRMMGILALLSSSDSFFISHAYFMTLLRGASVQLVFGFEYAILMTVVFMIAIKYTLHTIDLRSAHPWESKAVYLLYAELVLNFIKVVLYMVFMMVMVKLHTFPLFTVRPMYLTVRAFKKALHDVVMSRRAIRNMNTLYPNATEEELQSGDNVCIICREEMTSAAKKLPCNHIFHTACLRSWFQRQQTCPTCRMDILNMPTPASARAQGVAQQPAAAQGQAPSAPAQTPGSQAPPQANGAPPAAPPNQQPGPMPMLPGFSFPFMHWPGAPLANPAGAPQNTAAPSTSTTTGPSTSTPLRSPPSMPNFSALLGSGGFGGMPMAPPGGQPMMSPFVPPMPFMLPFPAAPNLSGLSDEEVRAMEGPERAAVEARIQCLRNIQTLLDAACVQLQQYLSILSALSAAPQFTVPQIQGSGGPEVKSTSAKSEESNAGTGDSTRSSGSTETAGPSGSTNAQTGDEASSPPQQPAEKDEPPNLSSAGGSTTGDSDPVDPRQEVRNRRLQHFSSLNDGSTES